MTLLDTNIVIALIQGNVFLDIPLASASISIITKIELKAFRFEDIEDERRTNRFIESVANLPLSNDVAEQAAIVRRETRLKLPDAIIAATAIVFDAELITHDAAFQRVPGLRLVAA